MIRTKVIYENPAPEDGFRLLIMRKWPQGVKRASVDAWEKELGPSLGLLSDWRRGRIGWEEFKERYTLELESKRELIGPLMERGQRQTVTLLCSCREEERCHRTLLKDLVERAIENEGRSACP